MEYKIGDLVVIAKDLKENEDWYDSNCSVGISGEMIDFAGKTATIVEIDNDIFTLDIDRGYWSWQSVMFEKDIDPSINKKHIFRKYKRSNIAEMREYLEGEELPSKVSISQADKDAGSPKVGDMIARNPNNHEDMWLVAEKYFKDNFKSIWD
jgi:hypothetical protein